MKQQKTPFATQYPYLTYWINNWGYIKMGNDYDFPYGNFLMLIDQGGVCYEGDKEETFEQAFEKAEKYLREVEDRFDKEIIATLEAAYKKRD